MLLLFVVSFDVGSLFIDQFSTMTAIYCTKKDLEVRSVEDVSNEWAQVLSDNRVRVTI